MRMGRRGIERECKREHYAFSLYRSRSFMYAYWMRYHMRVVSVEETKDMHEWLMSLHA